MAKAASIRRILGLVAALGVLAGAQVLAGRARESARAAARADGLQRAQAALGAARDALAGALKDLEAQVGAAASLVPIKSLAADPDRRTVEDALQTELWWKAQRDEFAASGLFFPGGEQDAVVGPLAGAPPGELLDRARASRAASAVILLREAPALAAAAVVDVPTPGGPGAVVLLARALDGAQLKAISVRARAPLAIAVGRRVRATSGEAASALERIAGREEGGVVEDPGGAWIAAAEPVAPSIALWALSATADLFAQAERSATSTVAIVWALGALAAIAVLIAAFRRAAPPETEALLRETARQLAAAREQLARLTPAVGAPRRGTTAAPTRAPLADATVQRQTPPSSAPQSLGGARRTATTFGRYQLVSKLGAGGMGEVHLAVAFGAEGFKRALVIKRLRAELARESELVAQFIDEARLGARLVHANIVTVFDFGKVGDDYFLAQEYVNGRDLDRLAARSLDRLGSALPAGVALHAAHAVLQALAFAHNLADEAGRPLGLVHRDVSPNNVLVSIRGEVKLLDFGIVKAEGRTTETRHGIVKGNVYCMSPEQARGHPVDARSDLFSLGTTLYRCLAREPLYGKGNPTELLLRAVQGPTDEDLAKARALPEPFGRVLERALQPDPERRFPSAALFAAALPPPPSAAAAEAGALVEALYGEELAAERARLAQVTPPAPSAAAIS